MDRNAGPACAGIVDRHGRNTHIGPRERMVRVARAGELAFLIGATVVGAENISIGGK